MICWNLRGEDFRIARAWTCGSSDEQLTAANEMGCTAAAAIGACSTHVRLASLCFQLHLRGRVGDILIAVAGRQGRSVCAWRETRRAVACTWVLVMIIGILDCGDGRLRYTPTTRNPVIHPSMNQRGRSMPHSHVSALWPHRYQCPWERTRFHVYIA